MISCSQKIFSKRSVYDRHPIKAVKVMHTVALRNGTALSDGRTPANPGHVFQSHMSVMFAYHDPTMANTLGTPIIVFTITGSRAALLSHYQPSPLSLPLQTR